MSTDAFGHIQDELFGNGVKTVTDFDQASGLMTSRQGGIGGGTGLINSVVAWDLNGNLIQRQDLKLSPTVTENFFYDSLNRFDYSQRNGVTNADVTLDAIGNITWKQGVGSYSYHATKKRAVVSAGTNTYGYDAAGNMTSRNGSSISYASYNLPTVINAGSGYSSTLTYGAFRNRYKQVAVTPTGTETTIYVAGLMERVTRGATTEYRHIIRGSKGAAAVYTRVSGGANSTYYLHRDHLGSPELITTSAGAMLVRPSFGAYGERRDGTDWNGPVASGDLTSIANVTRRGFTGHEHLDSVGLIHMNGRVYDPVVARFLSADPLARVGTSQGSNRYAYVSNRPLTLIDPSGYTEDYPQCDAGVDANGNCVFPDLDGDIFNECHWGGPWMAGWSPACLGEEDPFWDHDPFADFDSSPDSEASGDGAESAPAADAQPEEKKSRENEIWKRNCARAAHDTAKGLATVASFTVAGARFGKARGAVAGLVVGGMVATTGQMFPSDGNLSQASLEGMAEVFLDGGNPSSFHGAMFSELVEMTFSELPGVGIILGPAAGNIVADIIGGQTPNIRRAGAFGAASGAAYLATYFAVRDSIYRSCMEK